MGEVITTHILKCTIFKNQFKKGEQKHVCLLKTGIRKKKKKKTKYLRLGMNVVLCVYLGNNANAELYLSLC